MEKKLGKVYLIPTTLGGNEPLEVLPISIKQTIESIDYYIVENEKTARRFIKKITPKKSQQSLVIELINKFTDPLIIPEFLEPCLEGKNIGVISEAGCPGVADPGAEVVKIAHNKNIKVVPLVGPSSILLALMASGLNGQKFSFNGYLPIDANERKSSIKKYEKMSREQNSSQIFIETPYRNEKLFTELKKALSVHTKLCIAVDITLPTEDIRMMPISEWRKTSIDLNKRPAIFLFLA